MRPPPPSHDRESIILRNQGGASIGWRIKQAGIYSQRQHIELKSLGMGSGNFGTEIQIQVKRKLKRKAILKEYVQSPERPPNAA